MKTMLKIMRMRKNEIPDDLLSLFEDIAQTYEGDECEVKFIKAMEEQLTKEQRFRLYEQNGSCSGTGYDKERKAFACNHGYYKHAPKGMFQFPASIETYFERCAGGRLYDIKKH